MNISANIVFGRRILKRLIKVELFDIIKEEGDYLDWIYMSSNGILIRCEIIRNIELLNLCGYIYLDEDNTFYGVNYDNIPCNVHCGLSFSKKVDDSWVIGFDCAHFGDLIPFFVFEKNLGYYTNSKSVYRDINYVKSECEKLAELPMAGIAIQQNHWQRIKKALRESS